MVEHGNQPIDRDQFLRALEAYRTPDRQTQRVTRHCICSDDLAVDVPVFVNHFWSRRQRAGSSLHRVGYRGIFNSALPRFFIESLSQAGEIVYDPFMGRGTTPIEAALLGRVPLGNDANPLSLMIVLPRLKPQPSANLGLDWLEEEPWVKDLPERLCSIFHPQTLHDLYSLRLSLMRKQANGGLGAVDQWNRMLALTSLAGPRGGYLLGPSIHPNMPMLPDRKSTRLNSSH